MSLFIPDGYTIKAKLFANAETGNEELEFSYRPATGAETESYLTDRERAPGKERSKINAKFLSDHLVSWSIRHNNRPVELTQDNCGRLHHKVLNLLTDIVSGYAKPDWVEGEPPATGGAGVTEADAVGN